MGETTELRPSVPARERILESAYDLFSRRGIRGVGIDEVIERAAVAKATLYRHFSSKDELVIAFLERREEVWTRGRVEAGARSRGRLRRSRCSRSSTSSMSGSARTASTAARSSTSCSRPPTCEHPVGQASAVHLENIRDILRSLATEAGLRDPDGFARKWHILMKGSIVSAGEGDLDAAKRAQEIGRLVLAEHRN